MTHALHISSSKERGTLLCKAAYCKLLICISVPACNFNFFFKLFLIVSYCAFICFQTQPDTEKCPAYCYVYVYKEPVGFLKKHKNMFFFYFCIFISLENMKWWARNNNAKLIKPLFILEHLKLFG